MRHAKPTFGAQARDLDDNGGSALFYLMSGVFLTLYAFALWYSPRHL